MNRTFNILWFEDTTSWYEEAKEDIKEIIEAHFLSPRIVRKIGNDSDIFIDSSEFNDFHLILMDYSLSDTTGDEIIRQIREGNVLTEIIFYSSDETKMRNSIKNIEPPVDGIYYAKRANEPFNSKVGAMIDKIVTKSESIINLRGLVLDNSSDFELRTKEILKRIWAKLDEESKSFLTKKVTQHVGEIKKSRERSEKKILEKDTIFVTAVDDIHFYQHSHRLRLLTATISILKGKYDFDANPKHITFADGYNNEISIYRNALGHAKASDKKIPIRDELTEIDRNFYQKIRKSLAEYDSLLQEIDDFIAEM